MKELEFNKKSWHSLLYCSTYGVYTPPDNICAYFWRLLFAIIIAVPAFVGHLINLVSRDRGEVQAGWFSLYPPLFTLMGIIMCSSDNNFNTKHWSWWKIEYMGFAFSLMLIILIGIILLALGGLSYFIHRLETNKSRKSYPKKPSPIVEGWKAFKGKYCTKIKWL